MNKEKKLTKEMITYFKQFLKENNSLKEFNQNLINKINKIKEPYKKRPLTLYITQIEFLLRIDSILLYQPQDLLCSAFVWKHTPQGHFFWSHLDSQWRKICLNKFNIQTDIYF